MFSLRLSSSFGKMIKKNNKTSKMTMPAGQMKFSKDKIEKIVSYIPYSERVEDSSEISNEEIWHVGSETMQQVGVVSEIFYCQINLPNEMTKYNGIPENVKLEDALRRFIDHFIEKAKSTVKNKTSYIRIFFDKFPVREFTTATILKEDMTSEQLYEILNDHKQCF